MITTDINSQELRNLIYDFLGSPVDVTQCFAPAIKVDSRSDDRLTPRFPVILHICKQLRQEYLMSHQNEHRLACHDYRAFVDWSKGFGVGLVKNLVELHLTVPITGSRHKLRARYEILRTGPYLRFWFDIGTGASLSDKLINDLSSGFAHRFPTTHSITVLEFLAIVHWLSTKGPLTVVRGALTRIRNSFNFLEYRFPGGLMRNQTRVDCSVNEYTSRRGPGEQLWDMTITHVS